MVRGDRVEAAEVVRQLGGAARWRDLVRYSTRHSAGAAVAAGSLVRSRSGVYALPGMPAAHVAAAAVHGLVSHQSAAAHWRLESLVPADGVHVTVPAAARPRPARGVTFHYADVSATDDHAMVTSPCRTVLDCARTAPFPQALAIADSALRLSLVTGEEVLHAARRLRGAGRQRVLRVAEAADARAANPLESGLRALVLEAGLGMEPQYRIDLPSGPAFVDLADPVRRIVLEAEGFEFHGTRDALVRDCRRYDELTSQGWLVLRFSWQHVTLEQQWVTTTLLRTWALRDDRRPRP